ncbi:MAG: diguanylate cyclase [Schwartzia sp.]|nr:diguanylate cyclase [Schwartzia sp. (in: firmicutes)]
MKGKFANVDVMKEHTKTMKYWIVIVDDEALILANAKSILNEEDMRVSCLRSGQDLLKFMAKNEPDLILLDILMPEMDGFETYQELRRLEDNAGKKRTPVIFLTGADDSETERRGLKAGASDFIRKPLNRDILIRRVYNTVLNAKTIESLTEEIAIDKLTGFLNKAAGTEKISKLCGSAAGMLMVFDLDSFKLVNDLYGHDMGDRVLKAFSEVARRNMREGDVMARIGGDEFMAFCRNMENENGVATLTQRLNEQLRHEAVRLMGEKFDVPLGISVGAALVPEHGREYDLLFSLADGALYRAKQNRNHGYAMYQPEDVAASAPGEDIQRELARIVKIVEERNDAGGALLLGLEQFSFIYRFIKRFSKRYGGRYVKLLFILTAEDGEAQGKQLNDAVNQFGLCLQETLRKSDSILQSRRNNFFLLIPELSEKDFPGVLRRIMAAWEKTGAHIGIKVDYAVEFTVYERPGVNPEGQQEK